MACSPCSADKTADKYNDSAQYEKQINEYAQEPEPSEPVTRLLTLLETCVGGQYVIGGQGDRITKQFLQIRQKEKPYTFTKEQTDYLSKISRNAEASGWRFPDDYAWDCSGLWWWGCNEIELYHEKIDCTAYITYHSYCTPINKADLRPGDLVFYKNEKNRIVHMGIVGKNGYVFEAVSVFGGVVKKRTIEERTYKDIANGGEFIEPDWNIFGRPKIFN